MARHELKTWAQYFQPVTDGTKTFEIRRDDRGFFVGDELLLVETDGLSGQTTGRSILVEVTYITNFQQTGGYVVMAIKHKETSE